MVATHATHAALRIKEIEQTSAQDSELQAVRKCLIEGKWDSAPKHFLPVRNELTFIGHVIFKRNENCYSPVPSKESDQPST